MFSTNFILHIKSTQNGIDFIIRPETVQLLEENTGRPWRWSWQRLFGYDHSNTGNKTKNRQIELHQTKNLLKAKEILNTVKRQWTRERIYLQTIHWLKANILKM
jgi:hypothetical protein